MKKSWIALGVLVVLLVVGLLVFWIWYANWVNYAENYQLPFTFDKFTGKIEHVSHTGWLVLTPWSYDFHTIDLRPRQMCINANNRVLNCKLVKFNPDGLKTFVEWHGASAFDEDEAGYEILESYAFDRNEGTDCPFLIVVSDMSKTNPASPTAAQGVVLKGESK